MLKTLGDTLDRIFQMVLACLFAGLIGVVFMQVAARNILMVPMTWTLDLAQLLFSWCIFLGAAFAYRRGGHYLVNLWPKNSPLNIIPKIATYLAAAIVVYVLVRHGIIMSLIGLNRVALSLNISEFWFYLPIPICGAFIGLFTIEALLDRNSK
ncbi:TRAP transporter small permease [Pararhizobium sp. IMCC21322]|uniref:TRAP transporter small permease n=1 Tax=Pararhizobium sp. IMCC21322 TaxID=3067903 RepID=UPI002741F2A7|nr:TRAP transporter small permease subunit [Pararhizobium sp. IMCC21322]